MEKILFLHDFGEYLYLLYSVGLISQNNTEKEQMDATLD